MSVKSNVSLPVHEQAGLVYQQDKQQLCVPTPLPNPSFSETSTHPNSWEGRERCEGDLSGPELSLDEVNEKVYIADYYNNRVQVLSFQGKFLAQFGKEVLSNPCRISVTEDHSFVTDTLMTRFIPVL